jgi:CheY-like chemotaxis protein
VSEPAPSNRHILVVEDDEGTREALGMLLGLEGYRVASAANGREALDRLRRDGPPDLILLDLMMPVMTGWEFREEQRRDPLLAHIPVIVVSAAGGGPETVASLGAAHFLSKPVDFDELLASVRGCC